MERIDFLNAAIDAVTVSRNTRYGEPERNFAVIAELWNVYLGAAHDVCAMPTIEPKDVAVMMALLKVARIATGGDNEDNWIDAAGYIACGGEIEASTKELLYNMTIAGGAR